MEPLVSKVSRSFNKEIDWERVLSDKIKLLECFSTEPVCFVRAADAEMYILGKRRLIHPERLSKNTSTSFIKKLAESLGKADLVGLPNNYTSLNHIYGWDEKIITLCKKFNVEIDKSKVISAFVLYYAPEILAELLNNKKVLWINFEAHKFVDLMKDKDFCQYYGFRNIESQWINIPDGKGGWMFSSTMDKVVDDVIKAIPPDFDIAVIGAGAMANLIAIYIKEKYKKSSIDAGAVLSAMRGQKNRGSFRREGKHTYLVW